MDDTLQSVPKMCWYFGSWWTRDVSFLGCASIATVPFITWNYSVQFLSDHWNKTAVAASIFGTVNVVYSIKETGYVVCDLFRCLGSESTEGLKRVSEVKKVLDHVCAIEPESLFEAIK